MKHLLFFILLAITINPINAQDSIQPVLDERYREDQFYASITYNLLNNLPDNVSQNEFSTGFHLGFIRDMPLNKRRNLSIGLGLGISSNSYNQNIVISEEPQGYSFAISDDDTFGNITKNKFTTYLIDVPLEFRWRTSTAKDYKFWRVYSGFKFSYLVYNSTKLRSDLVNTKISNIDAFNDFQYGLTFSAGYGLWNFHVYYALNPIFNEDTTLNNQTLDLSALKIGIIFYIL